MEKKRNTQEKDLYARMRVFARYQVGGGRAREGRGTRPPAQHMAYIARYGYLHWI